MKHDHRILLKNALATAAIIAGFIAAPPSSQAEASPVAVEVTAVAPSDIRESADVVGTLKAKFQVEVKAEYPGVISRVHITEWVRVKKGDLLAGLDTREAMTALNKARAAVETARANLLEAKVGLQRAEREYHRMVKLKESGLSTQQNLDEARTETEAASARQAALAAQLNAAAQDLEQAKVRLSKAEILAPMDGVVSERHVSEGDLATDKPLFTLVDNRILDLMVTVPSKYLKALKPGLSLVFTTDAFPGETFTGTVKYINPAVNEADRSVKVIAEVANDPEVLKSGLFVTGRILMADRTGALMIPRNALIDWDVTSRKAFVWKVENNTARKTPVTVGMQTDDRVEILSGVSEGDRVISRGGFTVSDGGPVTVMPSSSPDSPKQ